MTTPDSERRAELLAAANERLAEYGRIDADIAEVNEVARIEHDRINDWLADRTAGGHDRLVELDRELREIAERLVATGDGAKTFDLPAGSVSLRKASARVDLAPNSKIDDVPPELVTVPSPPLPRLDRNRVHALCEPGPVIDDYDAPDGYEARSAVLASTREPVPGVVFLTPLRDALTVRAER